MRFSGERLVDAPAATVWTALHDVEVLRSVIPGCSEMRPCDRGTYSATLEARVGPIADTYRGSFSLVDLDPGSTLQVLVRADGRMGRLQVHLSVTVTARGDGSASTLTYVADAAVGGMVSRLGRPTLTVAGNHFTGCFFRDLGRALVPDAPARLLALAGRPA